jgi:FkbM family methyltransferase
LIRKILTQTTLSSNGRLENAGNPNLPILGDGMTSPNTLVSEGFIGIVRGRHGLMMFNSNDKFIGRSIELYGEFSEPEVQLFRQLLKPGDTAIEVGANIGAHSVPLAKIVGEHGHFLAFEPQHAVYQILCGNLALNGLSRARCYWSACGASPGEIVVPNLDQSKPDNFGGLALGQHLHGERVPVNTIDSLQLKRCDLLKVDVEGMELQVLHGARQTILRSWPYLYVENDRVENSPSLINYILELGYTCYWHLPPMYNPQNFFGNSQNVFSTIVSANMLCVPAVRPRPQVDLKQVEGPSSNWLAPQVPLPARPLATGQAEGVDQLFSMIERGLATSQITAAEQACTRIIKLDMRHFAKAWSLASNSIAKGQFSIAAILLERLSELSPDEPAIHSNLGAAYGRLQQHEKAAECFRKALQVQPAFADAHFNYGNALREIGQLQASVDSCKAGLTLQPDSALGHFLLANSLSDMGHNSDAQCHFQKALKLNPKNANAHKNLGILQLRMGEFAEGWQEYEWRFAADGLTSPAALFPQPYWDGSPLGGRRLLLWGEQGLGDQIQFMRYVYNIDGNVTLQVQRPLVKLIKNVWPATIGFDDDLPPFEVHAPLMSLPRILGTTNGSLLACDGSPTLERQAYLSAESDRVDYWRQRLAPYRALRIGIAWQGSRDHRRDRLRSIPLQFFQPLANLPGVQLVSLQKLDGIEQLADIDWSDKVINFSSEMDQDGAFLDSAAIIKNLDLVITIDSALAHLAGALAAPTWLLLRQVADWRWQMNGEHTPWYPSLTVLRQPVLDDWQSLQSIVVARLQSLLGAVVSTE